MYIIYTGGEGVLYDGPRAVYTTAKRARLHLPTRAASGVITPARTATPHPSRRPPSIQLYRCSRSLIRNHRPYITVFPHLPPRRPSANITHVDTAIFTAAAVDRRIYIYIYNIHVLYIYRHHHSSRARVIRPTQGCHSTCSSLLSNELPYIYISCRVFRCLPTHPPIPTTTAYHHHLPLRSYLLYTTIRLYYICIEQPSFSSTPSPHAKPFPLCHTSLSLSNYIVLRIHTPHYRINTTATVAVASSRAYLAATPQLPTNYYSCFVFMMTFSFIFLLVRFHPPLYVAVHVFFCRPASVLSLPRGLRVGIYCYKTTMYLRSPIILQSCSEKVQKNKEKKIEKIKKLLPCQSKTSVFTNSNSASMAFFDYPGMYCYRYLYNNIFVYT